MSHRLIVIGLTAACVVTFCSVAFNQEQIVRVPGAVYDADFPNEKPGPAPRRDLSGIWEPARGPGDAIGAQGAKSYPDTGRPEHQLPFTAAGLKANLANKPAWGPRAVASAVSNDPQPTCEPQAWPRISLHKHRTAVWVGVFQNQRQRRAIRFDLDRAAVAIARGSRRVAHAVLCDRAKLGRNILGVGKPEGAARRDLAPVGRVFRPELILGIKAQHP